MSSDVALDVAGLRACEFAWMDHARGAYLNAASTGPLPARAVAALHEFNERRAMPASIPVPEIFGILSRSRELAARMVGAVPEEIAVAVDTSYGINVAARSLPLEPGDVIVTSDREFPANVYPWMAVQRDRGAQFRLVPCNGLLPDEDALIAALDEPRVRVLAISWVSFASGAMVDLDRLGRACRERGIRFVVDAIQGLGAATLDVSRTPIDILACGAQKWLLSPWGSGFLYVRRELIDTMEPQMVSWLAVKQSADFNRLLEYDLTWHDDARRFELLTTGYQDLVGMNESLSLFLELGVDAVAARVRECADRLVSGLVDRDDLQLVTPADPARRAGIVVFAPKDTDGVCRRLDDGGVSYSLREGTVRLAPHVYTSDAELDLTLGLLAG